MKRDIGIVVVVLLMLAWIAFYVVHLVSVHQSCDGAVVKNVFDWPVCVH